MNTGEGKELTDKDEKEKKLKVRMIRGRKTGGDSLERRRVGDIRQERRERGRVNWNSGGQVRLAGFGQDQ